MYFIYWSDMANADFLGNAALAGRENALNFKAQSFVLKGLFKKREEPAENGDEFFFNEG